MKVLITFYAILATVYGDKYCHGIFVNNKYFDLEIIKDGINNLHNLAIDNRDDALYFTFDDITVLPTRRLGHLDMNTHVATVIDGIRNATAIAIDQNAGKVYVGGADGLFKINDKKNPEKLPIIDNIRHMHFKDGLYFTNAKKEAYKFEDGQATLVPELRGIEVDQLVIDNDNNIFFTNNMELFRIKLGTRAVNTHEGQKVIALSTDIYSKPHICTKDGLYAYNKYKFVFDKQSDLRNLKAITFNRANDAIYGVSDLLVKLIFNPVPCLGD